MASKPSLSKNKKLKRSDEGSSEKMTDEKGTLINLTPHDIHVYVPWTVEGEGPYGPVRTFPRSGIECRCVGRTPKEYEPLLGNVPVTAAPEYTDVEGFPEGESFGSDILVSLVVGQYLQLYPEEYPGAVYGPDTGPTGGVRDKDGKILGTRHLVLYKGRTE